MRIRSSIICVLWLSGAILVQSPTAVWALDNCSCNYGSDEQCGQNEACEKNWNPINCQRRTPDGGSRTGQCNQDTGQTLVAPCDATCSPLVKINCQSEDLNNISQSLELWRQAMTQPALFGGGTVNRILATQARDITVSPSCSEYLGWRVLAVMEMCRGNGFVSSPMGLDEIEDHVLSNLSADNCRIVAGNKCVAAITQGLFNGEGAVDPIIDAIPAYCPNGLPFGDTGLFTAPIDGVKTRLRASVSVLGPGPVPATSPLGVLVLASVLLATLWLALRNR